MVIVLIGFLIAATVFLALAETSLLASRPGRLAQRKNRGDAAAGTALDLATQPDNVLTTIEVCVTTIGIVLGAVTGGISLTNLPPSIKNYVGPNTHWLSALLLFFITLLMLLAQIVPKRLAVRTPENIASAISWPMDRLLKILHPIVALVIQIGNAILNLFPRPTKAEPPISDEELLMLVAQGTKAGVFEKVERDMFHAVLKLQSIRISSLMTPRTEMHWLDLCAETETVLRAVAEAKIWEMPVCDKTPDNVLGVIDVREALCQLAAGESISIQSMIKPALYVPDTEDALFMLETFKRSGHFIAVLLDEFGGVTGSVSIRSVIEEIVGDTRGTLIETIEPAKDDSNAWIVDGLTPIDEFVEKFEVRDFEEKDSDYATVAGLLMNELGHLPQPGEESNWHGLNMTVIGLDGHRISKIRVSRAA